MAYTFSTVACAEVFGTARENWTMTGRTAQVTLRCTWANRYLLMADILGNYRPWPYSAGLYPSGASFIAGRESYTGNGQGMDYEDANIQFSYGIPGSKDIPDPTTLASESLEPTVEFLTQDPRNYKWETASANPNVSQKLKEGEEPGKLHRGLRLVRTLYNLTAINSNILTLPGKVNSTSYVSALLGLTFPADTLLFIPPQISRTYTTAGASAWTVQLGWEYKENGWNKYWRQETQAWDYIKVVATDTRYYSYPQASQSPWLP